MSTPKIEIITHNKIHQSYLDDGGKVELVLKHLGQEPVTRHIGAESLTMRKAMIATPEGVVVTEQPELLPLTNVYWLVEEIAEENILIVNPKYEEGILSIEAYKRIQGVKVPITDFELDVYFTGYTRNPSKSKMPIKVKNNSIDDSTILAAREKGIQLKNTSEDVVGIYVDSSNIREFDLQIVPKKGLAFDDAGGFEKGKLEITK